MNLQKIVDAIVAELEANGFAEDSAQLRQVVKKALEEGLSCQMN